MDIRRCDVCGIEKEIIGVGASGLGPISFGFCKECIGNRAEPLWIIEHTILSCGGRTHMKPEWDEAITFFKDGLYIPAKEVDVTQAQIEAFWKELEAHGTPSIP